MRLQKKLVKSYKILNFWSTERIHRKIGIIKVYVEKIEKEYYNFLGFRSLPIMYHVSSLFLQLWVITYQWGYKVNQCWSLTPEYWGVRFPNQQPPTPRLYRGPVVQQGFIHQPEEVRKSNTIHSLCHLWVILESFLSHLCVTPESSLSHPWGIPEASLSHPWDIPEASLSHPWVIHES